jgi:hypothetical protein
MFIFLNSTYSVLVALSFFQIALRFFVIMSLQLINTYSLMKQFVLVIRRIFYPFLTSTFFVLFTL